MQCMFAFWIPNQKGLEAKPIKKASKPNDVAANGAAFEKTKEDWVVSIFWYGLVSNLHRRGLGVRWGLLELDEGLKNVLVVSTAEFDSKICCSFAVLDDVLCGFDMSGETVGIVLCYYVGDCSYVWMSLSGQPVETAYIFL